MACASRRGHSTTTDFHGGSFARNAGTNEPEAHSAPASIVNLERPMRGGWTIRRPHRAGPRGWRRPNPQLRPRRRQLEPARSSSRNRRSRYIVEKGSIAVDGISLTVAAVQDSIGFRGRNYSAHVREYELEAGKGRRHRESGIRRHCQVRRTHAASRD